MRKLWGSHKLAATVLAFSPDGRILVAGSFDGLEVLDADSGESRGPRLAGGVEVRGIEFSADGTRFLAYAASWSGVWRTVDLQPIWLEQGTTHWGALNPGGEVAAFSHPGGRFRLRVRHPGGSAECEIPLWRRPRGLAPYRDGFAVACEDGLWLLDRQARLRQALVGCCMAVAAGPADSLWALETNHLRCYPEGERIVCGPGYMRLQPFDAGVLLSSGAGARPVGRVRVAGGPVIEQVGLEEAAVSPDGRLLATSNYLGEVRLYELPSARLLVEQQAVGRHLRWLDSRRLAAAASEVTLWEV